MKKVLLPVMALLVVFVITPVHASHVRGHKVVYTLGISILGPRGVGEGAGGGPLFADGTVGGTWASSGANGQIIVHAHPTSWSEVVPGLIDVCFDVREIKGVSGFPPSFCLSDLDPPLLLPVSGTPILMDIDGDGNPDFMMRVTPAN